MPRRKTTARSVPPAPKKKRKRPKKKEDGNNEATRKAIRTLWPYPCITIYPWFAWLIMHGFKRCETKTKPIYQNDKVEGKVFGLHCAHWQKSLKDAARMIQAPFILDCFRTDPEFANKDAENICSALRKSLSGKIVGVIELSTTPKPGQIYIFKDVCVDPNREVEFVYYITRKFIFEKGVSGHRGNANITYLGSFDVHAKFRDELRKNVS